MKRLVLMRHAKSDWSGGSTSDFDRPLNARGRKAAVKLGGWLRDRDIIPDQVLSSAAERTGETCLLLGLPEATAQHFTRALYLASHQEILNHLHTAVGDTVLMVGHNPGIAMAAAQFVQMPPDDPQFGAYPTGATLVADFAISDWRDAAWGTANARHFVVPRAL